MGTKEKLKEADLYPPIQAHLQHLGYTVNSEVKHCDVTAVKEDILVIVEMKTTLNLDVILQAVERQKFADAVYIAVPKKGKVLFTKRWKEINHLLRRLEIGLLLVSMKKTPFSVEEVIAPVPFDRAKSVSSYKRRRKAVLYEINERHGDYNTGGSSRRKLVTVYRELAIQIAVILMEHGECSVKKIKTIGNLPEKTGNVLMDNHYRWFERVKRGHYALSEQGLADLKNYPELVSIYKQRNEKKEEKEE